LTSQSLYDLIFSTYGLSESVNQNSLSFSVQDFCIYPQQRSILHVLDTMFMLSDHWLLKVCMV